MNVVLLTIVLVIATFLWRGITTWQAVQKCLHCCGPLGLLTQWYTIMFIGIGVLVARTFYDIVVFEYWKYDFLIDGSIKSGYIDGMSDQEVEALHITPWLRVFSLMAPVFGFLSAFVVAEHVAAIVKASARDSMHKWERASPRLSRRPLLWSLDKETNMVLTVVAMPIVFILMAMRAEVRAWAVMTGSCWAPYVNGANTTLAKWEEVKTLELSVYTGDVEMCGFFVYITIFCFGRLCASYLRDAPKEYQFALKWAGLQGVYLYVIFGMLRSLGNVAAAIASVNPRYAYLSAVIQDKFLTEIGPIFTAATILCVYNMLIIGGMSDIKAKLGNVNMKFQGVRFLVLVAQVQLMALKGLTVGSKLYLAAEQLPPKYASTVHEWHLSTYRAQLMHAALLNYECFLVVLWQRCLWGSKVLYKVDARELPEEMLEESARGEADGDTLKQRLLPAVPQGRGCA